MCGLVGFYSMEDVQAAWPDRRKFLAEGLHITSLRGKDSTGLALVRSGHKKKTKIDLVKEAVAGPIFVAGEKYKKVTAHPFSNIRIAMGHNRAATVGVVSDENAHPYRHQHITLTHNGTLGHWQNPTEMAKYRTDSEYICHMMAEKGEMETLESIVGAYALVWYNNAKKTFNMARNNDRELFFAYSENGKHLFYSSEKEMLQLLMKRAKIPMYKNTVYCLSPKKWFSVKMGEIKHELVEFKEKLYNGSNNYNHNNYNYNNNHHWYEREEGTWTRRSRLNNDPYEKLRKAGYVIRDKIRFNLIEVNPNLKWARGVCTSNKDLSVWVSYLSDKDIQEIYMDMDGVWEASITTASLIGDSLRVYTSSISLRLAPPNVVQLPAIVKTNEEPQAQEEPEEVRKPWVPFRGDFITAKEFLKRCAHGCGWCGDPITLDDAYTIHWTTQDDPVCDRCVQANDVTEFLDDKSYPRQ